MLSLAPMQVPGVAMRDATMGLELAMSDSCVRRLAALRRYQFMFRVSLGVVAASVLLLLLSVPSPIQSATPPTLVLSLVLIDVAVLTGYKVLTSTMRILDGETDGPPEVWRRCSRAILNDCSGFVPRSATC